jgi:nucleoside-diphosphate-sugar epimerase
MLDQLAVLATGRTEDFFAADLDRSRAEILRQFEGSRVLVLGGAGSIGGSTVALLSELPLSCLHVVDQSENLLAELVRTLRSREKGLGLCDFRALPLDLGSPVMRRFLGMERPYDWILNFAALKHVRSEKDICSALQMLDTNLLKPLRLWNWILQEGTAPSYFSVSTDKAADPVNLMGASKRIMEHLMFCDAGPMSAAKRCTSSRFANVAFSNGSLLESFLKRFEKRQPLACPRETKRFFISLREAGQICLLAAACGPNRHIVVPRLDAEADSHSLKNIAVGFLSRNGLEPECYDDETRARVAVQECLAKGKYPVLLTQLDTQGEKPCEIFVGPDEEAIEFDMKSCIAVRYMPVAPDVLEEFVTHLAELVEFPERKLDKRELVEAMSRVVPVFQHVESTRILDGRM